MNIKLIRFILKTAVAVGAFCSVVPRLLFYGSSCCQERTRPAGSNSSPDGRRISPRTTTARNKSRCKAPTATAVFKITPHRARRDVPE
jgi:L,D-transpeptidase ErfK/SrfK